MAGLTGARFSSPAGRRFAGSKIGYVWYLIAADSLGCQFQQAACGLTHDFQFQLAAGLTGVSLVGSSGLSAGSTTARLVTSALIRVFKSSGPRPSVFEFAAVI